MDTAEAHRVVRERMLAMADGADPATPVPDCPGWTVTELLAHGDIDPWLPAFTWGPFVLAG